MRNFIIANKRLLIVISAVLLLVLVLFMIINSRNNPGDLDETFENGEESGSSETIIKIDTLGPFTISYLGVADDGARIVSVSDSSPKGRAEAVKWLTKEKFDMKSIDIRFVDFQSPLPTKEVRGE